MRTEKIRLTGEMFGEHKGTEVMATLDIDGSADMGQVAYEKYGARWAFEGYYEVVEAPTETTHPPGPFTLNIKVSNLMELAILFESVPEGFLNNATLTKD